MVTKTKRIGRNSLCQCGSGKKYKHCCLKVEAKRTPAASEPRVGSLPPLDRFSNSFSSLPVPLSKKRPGSSSRKEWKELHFSIPLGGTTVLNVILHHSDRWLKRHGVSVGGYMQVDLPQINYSGQGLIHMIKTAETKSTTEGHVHLALQRHGKGDPGEVLIGRWKPAEDACEERQRNRRLLTLYMEHPDGGHVDITLIRSINWMNQCGAEEGGQIFLDLAEMGARGWAKVVSIEPCPPIERGLGRMVTGTFHHSAGMVGDLKIAS